MSLFDVSDRFYINEKQNSINLTINDVDKIKLKKLIFFMFNNRGMFYQVKKDDVYEKLEFTDYHFNIILSNNQVYYFDVDVEAFIYILFCFYMFTYEKDRRYRTKLLNYLNEIPSAYWYCTDSRNYRDIIANIEIDKIVCVFKFYRNKFDKKVMGENMIDDLESNISQYPTYVHWSQIKDFFNSWYDDDNMINLSDTIRENYENPYLNEQDPDLIFNAEDFLVNYNYALLRDNFVRLQNNNNRFHEDHFDHNYYRHDTGTGRREFIGEAVEKIFKKVRTS